jgi:D-glycero-beta-D-manno-heptose 1-phosphate adenylyltransferase
LGQVVSQSELILYRADWKRNGQGVVCASGCFDLLHPGHIRLFEQARSLGDVLVVAVESDATARGRNASSKKSSAGLPRPITPAAERAEILASLAAVDYAVEFDDPSHREFIARLMPDVFVLGGVANVDELAAREAAAIEALGCEVVRIPLEPGYSTTGLIDRIIEFRQ